jgi:protease-4
LQSTYRSFIDDVAKGRKMELEVVRKLADGRVYTGTQAKENGLVDAIGTLDQAIADLRGLARQQFALPDSRELPIRRSPASFEKILDQLLSESGISISSPLGDLLRSTVLGRALNLGNGVSDRLVSNFAGTDYQPNNYDPPILLMPSWAH